MAFHYSSWLAGDSLRRCRREDSARPLGDKPRWFRADEGYHGDLKSSGASPTSSGQAHRRDLGRSVILAALGVVATQYVVTSPGFCVGAGAVASAWAVSVVHFWFFAQVAFSDFGADTCWTAASSDGCVWDTAVSEDLVDEKEVESPQ